MQVFVARQPIFDRERRVYGYELLYRSQEAQTKFDGTDASSATEQVISSVLMSIGLDQMLNGKKAFLNFNHELLAKGMHLGLPPQNTVIEILETVQVNADVIALCRAVRDQGYTLALDDFIGDPSFEPLVPFAKVIKVDLRLASREEQEAMLKRYRPRGIAMLAEKVETPEEFEWAKRAGYEFFQGYFFARPVVVKGKQLAAAKINCLRLLSELQKAELDFKRIEGLIQSDVALTYKLLRYVNSAAFATRTEIRSIERALTIMGSREIRRWVALATLPKLASDKPDELTRLAIVRARFCERLIQLAGAAQQNEAFLIGMFSLLDALLDCPLNEALGSVALAPAITGVLLGTAPENDTLRNVYRLSENYEQGDWDEVERLSALCGFTGTQAGAAYVEAAAWADQMKQSLGA